MANRSLAQRAREAWSVLTRPAVSGPAPAVAARPRRRAARAVPLSHYRGAEISRLTGDSMARAVSPVEELRGNLRILRARARDFSRNDPFGKKFLNVTNSQVLGPCGPRLQAQVLGGDGKPDTAINSAIESGWKRYCEGPVSIDGTMNFYEFEQLAFRTMVSDGECFVRPVVGTSYRHGLALQGIDPDLVDETYTIYGQANSNEIWLGVEVDEDGARQAYHIFDGLYSQPNYGRIRKRIPASEILHCFLAERFNQARGVTWFAPVLLAGMHLNGFIESVLVGSRAAASQMGVVQQSDDAITTTPAEAEGQADGDPQAPQPTELETEPGMILRLAPGEEFASYTPTQPTALFDPYTTAVCRFIATGLGISYAALTGDFSKANYSSERAAQLVERILYKMLQERWIWQFRQRVYERWLETAVLSGAIRLPSYDWRRYSAARWIPKGFDWVDPMKDVQALHLELELGLTSVTRALNERGEDLEEIFREIKAERELAGRYGLDLEQMIASAGRNAAPAPPEASDTSSTDAGDEKPTSGGEAASLSAHGPRPELAAALNGKHN